MGLFGKKKEKTHSIKYVVLTNGLPNFMSDCVIEIIINEANNCMNFIESSNNHATASLPFEKIIRLETGTKIGVVPKTLSKNEPRVLQTLKIIYYSNGEEKEINLCETNNYGTAPFNLLKTLLNINIQKNTSAPTHIDL